MISKAKHLTSVGDILSKYKLNDTDKYVSREFQKYAYDLAEELGDMDHKSLYMKLAKETPRICQFVVAISLGSRIAEIRCFFKQPLCRLRGLWNGAACQSEFDQALEVKHDGHHE